MWSVSLRMSFALIDRCRYKTKMKAATHAILLVGIVAAGCGPAREVGHIVTAPIRLVRGSDRPPPQSSDVDVPGRQVKATPTPRPHVAQQKSKSTPAPAASPSPAAPSSLPQFPVAKSVPGKPGLVYNPFDPKGGLIDVSGYASGSKVKDPDSQKIFVVP